MTINCKGQLIDLATPKVMEERRSPTRFDGVESTIGPSGRGNAFQAKKMLTDGATFIEGILQTQCRICYRRGRA
jgi:hypothetical protein